MFRKLLLRLALLNAGVIAILFCLLIAAPILYRSAICIDGRSSFCPGWRPKSTPAIVRRCSIVRTRMVRAQSLANTRPRRLSFRPDRHRRPGCRSNR